MNDQYYTADPTSESKPIPCAFPYRGYGLNFMTDAGVFSKGELDVGSRLLLDALPALTGDVLDIGCGCGTDSLLAALSVGEQGRVTGIDLSPAMIRKARRFAEAAHIGHAEFIAGDITAQTFPLEHFDAVLSNGVFNLIPDKEAALRQIYSLLKRGGRLVIADQVRNAFTSSPLPASDADAPSPASWAQ